MQKIMIYMVSIIGGTVFGFGVAWLVLSLVFIVIAAIGGRFLSDLSGGWIGYPLLLIVPVGTLIGIFLSLRLAKKMSSYKNPLSSLSYNDKMKTFAFIVAGMIGFAFLVFGILKDSHTF